MTRKEFITEIKTLAEKLENGDFYFMNIGKNMIFANQHYGQVWVKINDDCSIEVDLFHESEEEKKGND